MTDWISAGCNVVMAGAVSYAAANAKDWLSTKINDKKFKFADDLIDKFCCLQQEGFYLHADVKNIINKDPELQGKAKDFSRKWQEIEKRESIYRRNIINVRTEMERMALWGLKPVNKNIFKEVIDSRKLSRLGWHIKPDVLKALNELKKSYRDVHTTHVKAWIQIKMTLNNDISESRLAELQKSIPILIEKFAVADDAYKVKDIEFHRLYVNIEEYFNIR